MAQQLQPINTTINDVINLITDSESSVDLVTCVQQRGTNSSSDRSAVEDVEEGDVEDILEEWRSLVGVSEVEGLLTGVFGFYSSSSKFVEQLSTSQLAVYEDWKDKEVGVVVKRPSISGFGLFVDEDVAKGGVILEYDGIRFPTFYKEMVSNRYKSFGIQ